MGFHIDNPEFDRLVAEVARITGESEADAAMRALQERREKLREEHQVRVQKAFKYLEEHVWPLIPDEMRGKPISQEEQDEILGYGPNGYCE